jgi:hypothetical protein
MCIVSVTHFHSTMTRIRAQFNGSLYVYYYHGPVTLLGVPVSLPSHFYFFPRLIIMTQSHENSPCIITQQFHFLGQLTCV